MLEHQDLANFKLKKIRGVKGMKTKYRTIYCGKVSEEELGKEVRIAGWVENIRDHGGVIFVDIRDEEGTVQAVSNDDSIFKHLTRESSVTITGTVRKRSEDDYNPRLKTGTVEILVSTLEVLGTSLNELPFEVMSSTSVSEDIRLKYRYLDLRNGYIRVYRSANSNYYRF